MPPERLDDGTASLRTLTRGEREDTMAHAKDKGANKTAKKKAQSSIKEKRAAKKAKKASGGSTSAFEVR
jgi:hypothetical protein